MKENLSILGSTGSIGTQTLEVAKALGIKVSAISGNNNIDLLEKQIREFKPKIAAVYNEKKAKILKDAVKDTNTKMNEVEKKVAQSAATFLGSQMEI